MARQAVLQVADNVELASVNNQEIPPDVWLFLFCILAAQIKTCIVQCVHCFVLFCFPLFCFAMQTQREREREISFQVPYEIKGT